MSFEQPDWNAIRKRNFLSALTSPPSWIQSANELQAAAHLLLPQVAEWWRVILARRQREPAGPPGHSCHAAYMMLMGFVVENLCKSILVGTLTPEEAPAAKSPKLPRRIANHNLPRLVAEVGLTVTLEEQELLERMKRAVEWNGRYPVAMEFGEGIDSARLADGKRHSTSWIGETDPARISALVARLRDHVGAPEFPRSNAESVVPAKP